MLADGRRERRFPGNVAEGGARERRHREQPARGCRTSLRVSRIRRDESGHVLAFQKYPGAHELGALAVRPSQSTANLVLLTILVRFDRFGIEHQVLSPKIPLEDPPANTWALKRPNGCVGDRRYSRIFRPSMTARSAPGSLTAGAPPSLCSLHSVRFTLFASLGVGAVMTGAGRAARKARRIEQREIERRLAVHQPLRDVASGRGRVLEAVASEADG